MLKYFFAIVFLALLWATAIVFELPLWIPAAVTGLVVAVFVTLALVKKRKARQASKEIEQALADQAAAYSKGVRPDDRDDIQAMEAEFAKAVAALKSSRLARMGKDALAVLPWYVIIGPPGAGKSTAILNSGLQFPYLSRRGGVRGVGGTRNCDWWLTNQGIILDTAGRYTTEADDQDEWLAFLDVLKRTRPRRPINGVLVAVPVGDLGGSEEEIQHLAKRIRERLDEMTARLSVVVPVYVLFTKCDLLPGFVETFTNLKKQERGQIFGFTLPLAPETDEPADAFLDGFDELARAAELRSLKRMAEERRIDVRERVYEFPQQLEVLRNNMAEFIGQLFASSIYQEAPIMRGVYFTSGTQEGRPIDRVMAKIGDAFGLRARVAQAQAPAEPRSYFLRDVFSRVVFPDREVAMASAKERRRQLATQIAAGGGALLAAAMLSFLPAVSYVKNRDLSHSSIAVADALAAARPSRPDGALADESFEAVAEDLERLAEIAEQGPRASLRFGMYQGDKLLPQVATAVRSVLIAPVLERFEHERQPSYESLRLYLLLTAPKPGAEPEPGDADWPVAKKWVAAQVKEHWSRRSGGMSDLSERFVERSTALYLAAAETTEGLFFERNGSAVDAARVSLRSMTTRGSAIEQFLSELDCARYNIGLGQIVGPAATWYKGDPVLSGAFTRKCWEEEVRKRFNVTAQKSGETWVTGTGAGQSASEAQLAEIRSDYFKRYIDEWKKFLRNVRVEVQPDMTKGTAMLTALTDKPRPFGLIMATVNDNVRLKEASPEEASRWKKAVQGLRSKLTGSAPRAVAIAGRAADALGGDAGPERPADAYGPEDVERELSPLLRFGIGAAAAGAAPGAEAPKPMLDAYHQELERLLQAAELYAQDKEYEKFRAILQTAKTTVAAWINRSRQGGWDVVLDAWLMPPLGALEIALEGDHGGGANASWCEAVVTPFDEIAKKRYPFSDSGKDADLQQVLQFFQPDKGVLWTHYNNFLKKAIIRVGPRYKLAPGDASKTYRPEVLAFLDRAHEITDTLYPAGPMAAGLNIEVRIKPAEGISKTVLEIDGQQVVYRNEPERWATLKWPGDKKKGASLRAAGKQNEEMIPEEGDWALLHLLDDGKVAREGDYLKVVWHLKSTNTDLRVDLRPAKLYHLLRGFTVPRSVAQGPSDCGR